MSSAPARTAGCCATMPTLRPPSRAKPVRMFGAQPGWISRICAVVDDELDDLMHVVWLARVVRDDPIQRGVLPIDRIRRRSPRRVVEIVLWQVPEDPPREAERLRFVVGRDVRNPAARRVGRRPTKRLRVDVLVGDGLHDVRPGDEHVARALDHDREVGDRRGVHRPAGTRAHHQRQLRYDTRGQRVSQEDVGVPTERHDALLDAGASRVVEPDDRCSDLHRKVHHLADLFRVRLGQRSAEDREVLAEHEDEPPVDLAVAGDHAVPEERGLGVGVAIRDECVELHERSGVEQQLQPLSRGELSALMLLVDALLSATEHRLRSHRIEACGSLLIRRQCRSSRCGGPSLCTDSGPSYGPTYPPKW